MLLMRDRSVSEKLIEEFMLVGERNSSRALPLDERTIHVPCP